MHFLRSIPWMAMTIATSSCMTYQYVTLSSDLSENLNHEFTFENDSIMIRYNFNGENCPISLYLENKLNTPLYVDWKRSAVIRNNQSNPYWQNESVIHATANKNSTYSYFSNTMDISGSIYQNESTTFLPPHSYKLTNLFRLENELISAPGPKRDYSETIAISSGNAKVYFYDYEKENSPRHFRSFITLSAHSSFEQSFTFDHEFWVSEVIETSLGPSSFSKEKNIGNQYYLNKSTGAGTVLGTIALVILVLLGINAE